MESSRREDLSSDQKKAIEELIRGREFANQLRILTSKSLESDGSFTTGDLVTRILDSFTNTLSILRNVNSSDLSDEVSQIPRNCWDGGRKYEDSGESLKSSMHKDRRGCYKRRKSSHTWSKDEHTLVDDGHAWRKYGQKPILNAKHPRNYFRCTHKLDQGCPATKQVQIIQDDPTLYRTTYFGQHTCKNYLKTFTATGDDSSILLSFDNTTASTTPNHQDYNQFFSPFPSTILKQECKDDQAVLIDDPTIHNQSSSSHYLLTSADLTAFDSDTASTDNCLDFGHVMMDSDQFDDVLQFDF